MRPLLLLLTAPFALSGCSTGSLDHSTPISDISSRATVAQSIEAEAVDPASLFREDARSIIPLINSSYAYLDRFGSGEAPVPEQLRREAEQVSDRRSLLRHAERVLLTLADHHAITGSSLSDSWHSRTRQRIARAVMARKEVYTPAAV